MIAYNQINACISLNKLLARVVSEDNLLLLIYVSHTPKACKLSSFIIMPQVLFVEDVHVKGDNSWCLSHVQLCCLPLDDTF